MAWEGLAARAKTRHERINIFVKDVYTKAGHMLYLHGDVREPCTPAA
jgi:hypothetical protein